MTVSSIELDVRAYRQPEAQCGNTSLRMVCGFLGVHATIAEIARLAKTGPEGTEHEDLIRAAVAKGATVFTKVDGTLEELRWFLERGLPPIIGWWSMGESDLHFDETWTLPQRKAHDCGHFSVVSGITAHSVIITDPQETTDARGRTITTGRCERPRRDFLATWYDTDTPAFRRVDRWYMVVNFDGQRFSREIRAGRDVGQQRRT